MSGGKGNTAHFVWRCSMCKRESSAKFEEKIPTLAYSADNNGQFAPFLTMDCRGLEFIGFDPRVSLKIMTTASYSRTIRELGSVLALSRAHRSMRSSSRKGSGWIMMRR